MLINLSNHPSDNWPENQLELSRSLFGQVVDVPFPHIDPAATTSQVRQMAALAAEKAMEMLSTANQNEEHAIHVMGELTFCYNFVDLMRGKNTRCLASTTHRVVEETEKGKLSKFVFVGFRNYF